MVETLGVHVALLLAKGRRTRSHPRFQALEVADLTHVTGDGLQLDLQRARLIGSFIGLTDEQFNSETAPNQWTYRVVAKHVLTLEQDSLRTIAADRAARTSTG